MRIDHQRIQTYLYDIKKNTIDLEDLLKGYDDGAILQNPIVFKAIKTFAQDIRTSIPLSMRLKNRLYPSKEDCTYQCLARNLCICGASSGVLFARFLSHIVLGDGPGFESIKKNLRLLDYQKYG
ncbi:MAG: hypothetical protein QMC83_03715 [Thermodesulfovibrionales bacterium]|nr:hypothetical protein [Thermodesulfovibrionales bacterium]